MSDTALWRCEVCGYIHAGERPPDVCPVCGAPREVFVLLPPVEKAPVDVAPEPEPHPVVSPLPRPLPPRPAEAATLWRCEVCGYVHRGAEPPASCPVCGAPGEAFVVLPTTEAAAAPPVPRTAPSSPGRLLVLGGGIAGLTAAEVARQRDSRLAITLLSGEPGLPYYRLNLTRFLAGEVSEESLWVHDQSWFEAQRIELIHGEAVQIDRSAGRVLLEDGSSLPYDRLLLACGARPFLPPLPGMERDGVLTLRTLADARRILERAKGGGRCVTIGGGLLGLEIAGALARRGLEVTVLEAAEWLLPRQLARPAALLLEGRLRELGLGVRCGVRCEEVAGTGAVREVRLRGGEVVPAELIIVAAGIRPDPSLARGCGLPVGSGVLVDDRMATADPAIWAAGDGTEHRGMLYGIWPASYVQGVVAGTNAAGGAAVFAGLPPIARLKVLQVDVLSIGRFQPEGPGDRVLEHTADDGRYWRLLLHDGRVAGANLYGDASLATPIQQAVEQGTPLAELGELLARLPGTAIAPSSPAS